MNFLYKLVEWMYENPWTVVVSILANILATIKGIYSIYKTHRLGKAKLAGRRFRELYIPLSNELYKVKIESYVYYKGKRTSLFKKFLKEFFKLIILKGNFKSLKNSWKDFRYRILIGPTYEFPWDFPNFDAISNILIKEKHLLPRALEDKWENILVMRRESYMYSEEELDREMAEFIIHIRKITKETQKYLEKKYPNVLADQ